MKFKWLQKKLTFVIIPEANESIMRLRMSRASICVVLLSILAVLCTSAYVYIVHFHTVVSTQMKENKLQVRTSKLEQDLTNKNKAIEQLQNELFHLSKQATEVRNKVEEMKKLERELKKLSASGSSGSEDKPVSAALSMAEEQPVSSSSLAMGGPPHPVTEQQVKALTMETQASYASLQKEMTELELHWVKSRQTMLHKQEQALRRPGLWPTLSRTVTSPFGYRKDPFTSKLSFHRGIDIAGKMNDPVFAAAKGTVLKTGSDKFHGNHIILEHGNGLRTWYMHLNEIVMKQGDPVDRGQLIGKLGTSGRSTGPHLHYEILKQGKSTDPAPFLPQKDE